MTASDWAFGMWAGQAWLAITALLVLANLVGGWIVRRRDRRLIDEMEKENDDTD